MFEKFTYAARQVIVEAQHEARRLSHNFIGTEHFLLGLLRADSTRAATVLTGAGMTLDAARREVQIVIGFGTGHAYTHLPFTPRSKKVLELCLREALIAGSKDAVDSGHLLCALLREGEGVGAQIVRKSGLDYSRAREQLVLLEPDCSYESTLRSVGQLSSSASAAITVAYDLAAPRDVETYDLLLALMLDEHTVAARALHKLGVTTDRLTAAIEEIRAAEDE